MFWSDLGPEIGYEAIGIVDSKLDTVGFWSAKSSQDTPKHAATVGNIRGHIAPDEISDSSDQKIAHTDQNERSQAAEKLKEAASPAREFHKGVVFYLRNQKVVGILLWNNFNQMQTAREVLKSGRTITDTETLSGIFKLHN